MVATKVLNGKGGETAWAVAWGTVVRKAGCVVGNMGAAARAVVVDEAMTVAKWEETVVEPVRGLIRDLETLSEGWGKGAVAIVLINAGSVGVMVCIALSPTLGPWAVEQTGVAWAGTFLTGFCAVFAVANLFFPLSLLAAPADLSTACDDMKDKLNAVRISDLSPEIDARLIILERAMANVNNGQGVGFAVHGIVIDNKMLEVMALQVGTLGFAGLTALLAYEYKAPNAAAAAGGSCAVGRAGADAAAARGRGHVWRASRAPAA